MEQLYQNAKINISKLIQTVSIDNLYKKIISSAQKLYNIRHLNLQSLSLTYVQQLLEKYYQNVFESFKQQNNIKQSKECSNWATNEFKIFSWISVCYAYISTKSISKFDQQDLKYLNLLFPNKPCQFLSYHLRSLVHQSHQRRTKWIEEQINLLSSIVNQDMNSFKWTYISFQLYLRSGRKFYRSPQKCRQQWINHLNPEVNKQQWSIEEDIALFKYVTSFGTKWSNISKHFNGTRTQHMVKNRFKSIYNKYLNRSSKFSQKKLMIKIMTDLQKKYNLQNAKNFSEQQNQSQQKNQETQLIKIEEDKKIQEPFIIAQNINQNDQKNNNFRNTRLQSIQLDKLLFDATYSFPSSESFFEQRNEEMKEFQLYQNIPTKIEDQFESLLQ